MPANLENKLGPRTNDKTNPKQPLIPYTTEVDVSIIQWIAEGRNLDFICQRTNRTTGDILKRITIYIENHKNHALMQEISFGPGRILGMDFNYIDRNITRLKAFKRGRGKGSLIISQDPPV